MHATEEAFGAVDRVDDPEAGERGGLALALIDPGRRLLAGGAGRKGCTWAVTPARISRVLEEAGAGFFPDQEIGGKAGADGLGDVSLDGVIGDGDRRAIRFGLGEDVGILDGAGDAWRNPSRFGGRMPAPGYIGLGWTWVKGLSDFLFVRIILAVGFVTLVVVIFIGIAGFIQVELVEDDPEDFGVGAAELLDHLAGAGGFGEAGLDDDQDAIDMRDQDHGVGDGQGRRGIDDDQIGEFVNLGENGEHFLGAE